MKVLIVGDPPGAPGGIAQVMNLVSSWCSRDPSIDTQFLDPLGKATSAHPNVFDFARTLIVLIASRPDVVHLNTASRGSTYRNIAVATICRILGIPYIVHLHGGGYPKFLGTLKRLQTSLVRSYFQRAAKVIALTPSWKHFVVNALSVSNDSVSIIPNGTASPRQTSLDSPIKNPIPTFVYAGRLTVPKGVHELIDAFSKLPQSSNARLMLIGGSKDRVVSAALSASAENVIELGWRSNSETLDIMSKAWAVILPSHFENMPLTVLEAMSVSTAVLATDVGGVPEMIRHDVDGLLLSPGDTVGLTNAIASLCDADKSLQFGKNGRKRWIENYTSGRMCESIIGAWRDASK